MRCPHYSMTVTAENTFGTATCNRCGRVINLSDEQIDMVLGGAA